LGISIISTEKKNEEKLSKPMRNREGGLWGVVGLLLVKGVYMVGQRKKKTRFKQRKDVVKSARGTISTKNKREFYKRSNNWTKE